MASITSSVMPIATTSNRNAQRRIKPIVTDSDSLSRRRKSSTTPLSYPRGSAFTLPSPSIVAAHAYYLEHEVKAPANTPDRRQSVLETQPFPEGYSAVPSPGNLASHLESFTFSPASKERLAPVAKTEAHSLGSRSPSPSAIKHADVRMTNSGIASSTKPLSIKSTAPTLPRRQSLASSVPFLYIHTHLRNWGPVYLGNSTNADALIQPFPLRRASLVSVPEPDSLNSSTSTVVRARVTPKDKDKKPFLIQRNFDVRELRESIPSQRKSGAGSLDLPRPRRSSRNRTASSRRASVQPLSARSESRPKSAQGTLATLGKGPTPIHVEYALHFLPVLAALLLSGHVRKGDTIDLVLPHPEVWNQVVEWVYTGRPEVVGPEVRRVIEYLGGIVDEE